MPGDHAQALDRAVHELLPADALVAVLVGDARHALPERLGASRQAAVVLQRPRSETGAAAKRCTEVPRTEPSPERYISVRRSYTRTGPARSDLVVRVSG